ncbi:NADH dehydrogenase [ubiquinone] 1 alpha subcomplex assembly factor 2 isoform X1 [Lethenteron reissneri]|uniref:NADH dehydrogenase [ubiquinone] 1 alpha subcomplex assembly factor 2 isoform X1 n=2 Tax=Lethenteron reissneri TaxID=7753 RepID=UPI002AB60C91|nr:NADH dehydrogenase [ubiquinone] 1 alpha subcomplex assembly factor 2 isoform X1 [Lethenteron reissneri]
MLHSEMSRVVTLLRSKLGMLRVHIGTDYLGNKYYLVPEQRTWTGRTVRPRRLVEASQSSTADYDGDNIPMEWQAWMQGKRDGAPTMEEVSRREATSHLVAERGRLSEIKDEEAQQRAYEEGLVARAATRAPGHAALTHGMPLGPSPEPGGTAGKFHPGSWLPGEGADTGGGGNAATAGRDGGGFQPESWTPGQKGTKQ